jgi:ribosomal protein L11 methyltransferase
MWLNVTLQTDAAHAEELSDALLSQGALSVSIEDADAGTAREQPQFGEPGADLVPQWQASRLVALFDAATSLPHAIAAAAAAAGLARSPEYAVADLADQNWVQLTQSQFDPIRINDRLWIVPSWHRAPDVNALNITLDPGMAFGTGSHATTSLCLNWLCQHVADGATVLDYGTGSGILAIAAAKLGARGVVAVDIDDKALLAARENARRNGVALTLLHSREPLDRQFDRVVANILTNPLRVLAPLLSARVTRGGMLALSGVLSSQAAAVVSAYRPFISLRIQTEREGWILLEGTRP